MACFRLNTTYQIPSFCLNIIKEKTSEKSLISVKMRHIKFHFYAQLSYTKIYYLRKKKNTFGERCCFLTFLFEGNFKKYAISVKWKYMKTKENMIFSVLFTNFHFRKLINLEKRKSWIHFVSPQWFWTLDAWFKYRAP